MRTPLAESVTLTYTDGRPRLGARRMHDEYIIL